MKRLILTLSTLLLAQMALARSPHLPEWYEAKAKIVSLSQNNMFPVATGTVTFMKPCGAQFERIEQTWGELNDQGIRELKIEVILSKFNGPSCLALPRQMSENFEFSTTDGPVVLVLELSARAGKVVIDCVNDRRPLDGALTQVQLVKLANGRYKVAFTKQVASRARPGGGSTVLLASQLRCKFSTRDLRLVNCSKSSNEFGETMNSGFVTKLVRSTSTGGGGSDDSQNIMSVQIYSPEVAEGSSEAGFPEGTSPSGHLKLEFKAKECRAL